MTEPGMRFDRDATALIVIDSYNDFISDGGMVWDRLRIVDALASPIPTWIYC